MKASKKYGRIVFIGIRHYFLLFPQKLFLLSGNPFAHYLPYRDRQSFFVKDLDTVISDSIDGHAKAQRELYMAYRVRWYMVCLRYGKDKADADDIMQEGLIQIYNSLSQYNSDMSKFITWSSRVLAHAAIKYLKKNSWHKMVTEIEEVLHLPDESETVYDQLAAKEMIALLNTLPLGYKMVFNLHELEGYTHKEISQHLNITEGTSKSQLSKAKKMLKKKLEYQITTNCNS